MSRFYRPGGKYAIYFDLPRVWTKLTLFDLDVKKRKGSIRCNHCGAKINYDLDQRKIQQSGFWAERELL